MEYKVYITQENDFLYEGSSSVPKNIYDILLNTNFETVSKVSLPPVPRVLGSGKQGTVYSAAENKVIKVTPDVSEAHASSLVANKKLEGIWNVYGVYSLKKTDRPTFVIVGEQLKENSNKAKNLLIDLAIAFDELVEEGVIPQNAEYFETKWYTSDVVSEIEDALLEFGSKHIDNVTAIITGMYNLNTLKIHWEDLHEGNVMFRGSIPVIVDLGFSKSPKGKIQIIEGATK